MKSSLLSHNSWGEERHVGSITRSCTTDRIFMSAGGQSSPSSASQVILKSEFIFLMLTTRSVGLFDDKHTHELLGEIKY